MHILYLLLYLSDLNVKLLALMQYQAHALHQQLCRNTFHLDWFALGLFIAATAAVAVTQRV